jgi:transketolase
MMNDTRLKELALQANSIRMSIIDMLEDAGSGHTAGPLGMTDIFTALYFEILKHDPLNPEWEERDRVFLSNGHIVPVRYATMAHAGYFPVEELKTLRKFGSRLQGHPERDRLPGIEHTSGPLGTGLGQASGVAYAARLDNKKFKTFCLLGDGELNGGNIWESAMFAAHHRLDNLVAIVDRNHIQINGTTERVMKLEPLRDKWEAFGWHVIEIDGHNMQAIVDAVYQAYAIQEQPVCILAHTIPGKGIAEIENLYEWHGKPPTTEQEQRFLKELRSLQGRIEAGHME